MVAGTIATAGCTTALLRRLRIPSSQNMCRSITLVIIIPSLCSLYLLRTRTCRKACWVMPPNVQTKGNLFFIINLNNSIMSKFIETVIMLTIAACSWAVTIMLTVCTLPTTLDCVILYVIATMFAVGGTIAFVQFSHLWHSMFKQPQAPKGLLAHSSLARFARSAALCVG